MLKGGDMRRDYSPKDVFRLFDFAFVVDDEESTIVALQVAREASVMLADLFAPIDETFNLLNPRTVAAVGCSGDGGLALLLRLLDEGGRRIRLSVAAALGFVGGPGAREALERVAREPDDSLREVAIRALGTLPAEYQFKRLADITPRSRVIAALILRDQVQLDFREVAPLVVHPCEKIRDAARHAIIAGGTTDAIDTVFEIFAHRGAPLDTESVLFLGRTRDLRAIPPLLSTAASDEPESMVRDECIALLRKFPRARADVIAAVTRSFVDNPLVRRREGELIGKLVGANAIPVLLEGLKDVYRAVRENAARGLVAVGRDAVPHLLDLLQTPMASLDFRSEVIQILGEIGDSRALDAVEAMLPVVRDAAIRSLSGFRTVRAFDILQRLISVPATRQQAWASFKKLAANSRNSDSAHLLNVLEALLCLPDARIREDVFELFETLMYRRVPTESIIQSLLPALAKSDPELEKAVIAWLSKRPESNRPLVAAALQSANSLLQPPLRAALRAIDDAIAEEEQRQRE